MIYFLDAGSVMFEVAKIVARFYTFFFHFICPFMHHGNIVAYTPGAGILFLEQTEESSSFFWGGRHQHGNLVLVCYVDLLVNSNK
jgi:hypothetical protein